VCPTTGGLVPGLAAFSMNSIPAMADTDQSSATADQVADLQSDVERLMAMVLGKEGQPPEDAWYSYKDAAVRLHSGRHPSSFPTEEHYQHALQRAKDAGITPRKVADLARGDSCEWLQVTKVGRTPVITEKSIRAYKSALEGDAVKAQNRL
jgi:hypothetical protein